MEAGERRACFSPLCWCCPAYREGWGGSVFSGEEGDAGSHRSGAESEQGQRDTEHNSKQQWGLAAPRRWWSQQRPVWKYSRSHTEYLTLHMMHDADSKGTLTGKLTAVLESLKFVASNWSSSPSSVLSWDRVLKRPVLFTLVRGRIVWVRGYF